MAGEDDDDDPAGGSSVSELEMQPLLQQGAGQAEGKQQPQASGSGGARAVAASAHRADIDGLRCVAVTVVVAHHYFPAFCPGGFVGVDVFFVISGFLISGIIQRQVAKQRFSFRDFYARRIRRICPALIVVLGPTLAAGWWLLLQEAFEELGMTAAWACAMGANIRQQLRPSGYWDPDPQALF